MFNQPLSFDTSSATSMQGMFRVRSARALPAASAVGSSPRAACAAAAPRPPASRPAWHSSSYAFPLNRQSASAFNQPLSFNTSSVTTMGNMFEVRSARAPASSLHSLTPLHAACAAAAPRPLASRPALSSLVLSFPLDSVGSERVVSRQQVPHPLRMGGHLGLCVCWLWLELGSGELPGHIHDHGLPEDGGHRL